MALQKFADQFGRVNAGSGTYVIPTVWQSVGSGTPLAGVALGCLLAARKTSVQDVMPSMFFANRLLKALGARLGRKVCFRIIAAIATVGVLLQATAINNYWQIIGGRIVNSISMGIICK